MEIPPRYRANDKKISRQTHVLKLLMSLYGLRQAGKNWFLCLKASLLHRGFVQSQIDPCLFYSATVVIIVYVDDAILCGLNQHDINQVIESIKSDFKLTDEGDFHTYLGINMRNNLNGTYELIQPHLISKALDVLGLRPDSNPCHTPADRLLHRDTSGKERESTWSYRTVLGIFNYIAMTTRPDISFAVSQCARFAENPKQSHEQALKRIGRYLLKTKSGRPSRHPKRYGFLAASPIASFIDDLEQRILHPNAFVTHQLSRAHSHSLNRDLPFTEDDLKFPLALPANKTNANPDTPTYKQAMSGEHRHEFETAMQT